MFSMMFKWLKKYNLALTFKFSEVGVFLLLI